MLHISESNLLTQMQTTKKLEKFRERKLGKKVRGYSKIRTSYFLFHMPDPNHSSTTIVAADQRYFCPFYSYLYNTTPPY
jgi:hypothetical protein